MSLLDRGKDYFGALIKIRERLILQYQKSADQALGFVYQIATVTGVVAGFGFTAINHANRVLFITGECFLFVCIIGTLVAVRYYWISDLKSTEGFHNQINEKSESLKSALKEGNESKVKEIIDGLENFPNQPIDIARKLEGTLSILLILFTAGCLFLAISFIVCIHF